ncbi:CRISPR-associated ring nuclease Csm6 [Rubrivivax benzoatilyticus]|uniref:TIGR02584 family CRISPR-associated protein n=1 Tax=Rubrivivax benzoatilyticus TaxID=316997 RepID=A0ABX0I0Y6_9BURK|nr:CRISPR-associated ring nuclease Csm6 [Rubrivivax benzoatilyticus]EGJ09039.1 hypothetical protein RBXJA2T_01860 [Rubrivivax benzoatilyticus JA2 = ATCC BAA-35]NHK99506.1 TIGR02584 family CRISPR-associated protein [Rubrivivax benzoatilyticus]NHL25380.1 TIGR02584 family CRISPR-associated protein [Rubrivivax benzoatilyticus]
MSQPDPSRPESYPRRALVCMVGLSPQVVTETLYALATAPTPFVPTELHVVATAAGAQRVHEHLLEGGQLRALAAAHLGGNGPEFDPARHLHVVARDGVPLADVESAEDNTAVADAILGVVRPLALDPACAIHASLAGGRKSMGFYLGYVMSLLGRAQDRLSHVLVNSPFESHPGFFFPPAEPARLRLPDGREVDTAAARVSLAPVAFVRMSDGLPERLLHEPVGFDALVQRAQRSLGSVRLDVLPAARRVRVAGIGEALLEPSLMAWYVFFALRRQQALRESAALVAPGAVLLRKDVAASVGMLQPLMDQACRRVGVERQSVALQPADLRPRLSVIRKALVRAFGPELGTRLAIAGPADRGARDGQYGLLGIEPGQIHVA